MLWKAKPADYSTAAQLSEIAHAAAWAALRAKRDQLLRDSDWTQVSDAPVDQAAWAVYRGLLRDLPETTTDPTSITWPAPPSAGGAV